MTDRSGQQLGNYRLVRLLGEGGFAEVYLGEHIHLGTLAAIKLLYTQLTNENLDIFRTEARNLAHLIHPHIVRVLDFGVDGRTPFLVMDYAPHGTLRQIHPRGSRVPLNVLVSYVKQVADALQYAHNQKLIHRDIKPENMLLGRNNEILLSDFGIAVVAQSSRYQNMQDMAGTIAYMAPEQIQAHARPASDQYSLGVVVYEWLSGDRPFQGSFTEIAAKHSLVPPPPLREKIPGISPDIEQVVMTALSKDPKARFTSIQAFATALEQAYLPTIIKQPPQQPPLKQENLPATHSGTATPPQPVLSTSIPDPVSSPSLPSYMLHETVTGNVHQKQPALQTVPTVGFTQIPTKKTSPNFAVIIGTAFLLLVLIGGSFLFFTRNQGNTTGNQGGNTNPSTTPGSGNSAGSAFNGNGGKGCKKIGLLLPETATSARWEGQDRPDLQRDIPATLPGATVDYFNARGNADQQKSNADTALTNGDCILIVAASDTAKAATIVADAKANNVPVIAYDRLIQSNDLAYYVSFDDTAIGNLQGQYIIDHYKDFVKSGVGNVVMINGSQTDNNALLYARGAHQKLDPLFNSGVLKNVYEQYTPSWDNPTAQTEMQAALTARSNNIQIVYVANDGMANSVIAALKAQQLNGKVLVTGQDATVAGLQNILLNNQTMTVFKDISLEAQAAADIVAAISNGTSTASLTNGATTKTQGGANIPSVLETPQAIDKANVMTVITAGGASLSDVCQGLPSGAGGICP